MTAPVELMLSRAVLVVPFQLQMSRRGEAPAPV